VQTPSPAVRVVGRDPLVVTAKAYRIPGRKTSLRVTGAVVSGRLRRPVAGLRVRVVGGGCGTSGIIGTLVGSPRTDRRGRFSQIVRSTAFSANGEVCVDVGEAGSSEESPIRVYARVTSTP
jgi:hypothetical protein